MQQVNKPNQSVLPMQTAVNQTETKAVVLTPEQRQRLARRSSLGIVQILCAQALLALMVTLLSWWFGGRDAAASALIGAGAYFIPNTLFAVRLLLGLMGGANANPASFFMGEVFKLGSAIAILGLAAWQFQSWLVWPALLFGLIGVLKGYVVLLALGRLP
ncbi:ATP synthase subunit I [Paenalcaligenes faecalis]|uniref:ATP synthase subunit I n=1 Tax=Paenalcaligenes faecalis TaxID=2980099 RepID=UPI0022B9A9F5|nr:ATP synthase subunit I [Paenalcaligenes faecalis]